MKSVESKATEAELSALRLANVSEKKRDEALQKIAESIEDNQEEILKQNKIDVEKAEDMLEKGEYTQAFVDRLKVNENKVKKIATMVRSVAKQEDPLNRTLSVTEMDEELELFKVSVPIGVIGSIFESRPDALVQISSLCLKSGNAIILKGGSEAEKSNRIFYKIIKEATTEVGIPEGWIQLIEARKEVRNLLEMDEKVDLLIPRGSKEFIRFIQENSRIPVMGHADGICHTYVDKDADLKKAIKVSYDGKVQYPAVCNATETLLVHKNIAEKFLPQIAEKYRKAEVEMRGCERTREILKDAKQAREEDWKTEYLDLTISIKIVESSEDAIDHINRYSSKHTDTIISENGRTLLSFLKGVDSSSVMANASTRFSDGYRYGLGAEVGISTGKLHARGPVGLKGLTTYKYLVIGDGHIVESYSGPDAEEFTHKKMSVGWDEREYFLSKKE